LPGNRRHRDGQMLHIAIDRNQQRFVNLVGIQPEFAHHFITKVFSFGS
jgi:hypothetical protein